MCGLAGYAGREAPSPAVLERMIGAIEHRGPDATDTWRARDGRLGLGHARLAIQDLTSGGAQPMHDHAGRATIVFNGEIYNHVALREELARGGGTTRWRGGSDTETLLECIAAWGLEKALTRCLGMFAFALYEHGNATLTLARDRFGEKPLYYQPTAGGVLFASELGALLPHPEAARGVEPTALRLLLERQCIPAPWTIRPGVHKLLPGSTLRIGPDGSMESALWWSAAACMRDGLADPLGGTPEAAIDRLDRVLGDAVERQMIADVPLGAFLSGGVDSSLVVALMRERSAATVRTFSIGFDDPSFDEAPHARRMAEELGTEHTELYVTEADVLEGIASIARTYSEPFADSSQLPTALVSAMTREHVTVALSGDAGDEVFGGYNRHVFAERSWPGVERLPVALRRAASAGLVRLPESTLDAVASRFPPTRRWTRAGEKIHRSAHLLGARSLDELYRLATVAWPDAGSALVSPGASAAVPPECPQAASWATYAAVPPSGGAAERMMLMDQLHYLTDDILAKVDRAAMSVSLETRVPFLDPHVVELAWRLPPALRVGEGQGKRALKVLLARRVPPALVERPKMGFSIPVHELLRGPLRAWGDELLGAARLEAGGHFRVEPIGRLWREHLEGRRNHVAKLWPVLVFEAWRARWDAA